MRGILKDRKNWNVTSLKVPRAANDGLGILLRTS